MNPSAHRPVGPSACIGVAPQNLGLTADPFDQNEQKRVEVFYCFFSSPGFLLKRLAGNFASLSGWGRWAASPACPASPACQLALTWWQFKVAPGWFRVSVGLRFYIMRAVLSLFEVHLGFVRADAGRV